MYNTWRIQGANQMTIHVLLIKRRKWNSESKLKNKQSKEWSYNLLKRLISFKNKKTLSICTPLNNCLSVSTWKYLFLMWEKSPHSSRKWRTVKGASHTKQNGCSSRFKRYECVILVWTIRNWASTTSSCLTFLTTGWDCPITGLISKSLLPTLLLYNICHLFTMYLFIKVKVWIR